MKIFFPIIAALILLCVGSCGYANYCKKPGQGEEDDEVDRAEDVYTLNKPDRPYLTPHYQRRTFQPPPPAYDNHAFRPTQPQMGPKQVTQPTSLYQRHQPMHNSFVNSYQQFQPQGYNNHTIKPTPMRSYSFQVPQTNYSHQDSNDRSKSLWDVQNSSYQKDNKPDNHYNTGRTSPIQSTRSAPAEYGASNLRRTYSSPNLTPSGSNGSFGQGNYGSYGSNNNQFSNQFSNQFGSHRHSMNYGRNNPYQRTPSPASSNSTYIPAASEVGSTAPLFGRRRSPQQSGANVYEAHNPSSSRSQYGGSQYGGTQSFNQPRRSYEMEDIYGRGNGMSRYGFSNNQSQFSNSYDQQPNNNYSHQFSNQFNNYSQFGQNQQQNPYQQQQPQQNQQNSIYEHLQPQQDYNDPYSTGGGNFAYDPYNDPYNTHNSTLPGV